MLEFGFCVWSLRFGVTSYVYWILITWDKWKKSCEWFDSYGFLEYMDIKLQKPNLKLQTSNSKPQTPNSKPQTPNLKPQTPNLKPPSI